MPFPRLERHARLLSYLPQTGKTIMILDMKATDGRGDPPYPHRAARRGVALFQGTAPQAQTSEAAVGVDRKPMRTALHGSETIDMCRHALASVIGRHLVSAHSGAPSGRGPATYENTGMPAFLDRLGEFGSAPGLRRIAPHPRTRLEDIFAGRCPIRAAYLRQRGRQPNVQALHSIPL